MYLDSHAHFDGAVEQGDVAGWLGRAAAAGVSRMVAIGGSPDANRRARDLAAAHPHAMRATAGYDRDLAATPPPLADVADLLRDTLVCAVGETGLDYHYEPETAPAQQALFGSMLELATAAGKPVVVHSREADADTLRLLRAYGGPGVLHCFTGGADFARALLDLGLYISFSGIVTFRNAEDLRAVARQVPADRLLIETDAPYLSPVPFRGQPNEPARVVEVARVLAEVRGVAVEELARLSYHNACQLFGWAKEQTT